MDKEDGQEYIKDEADTFHIQSTPDSLDLGALTSSLPQTENSVDSQTGTVDYGEIVKVIVPHEEGLPSAAATPKFNHKLFYSSLRRYQLLEHDAEEWGKILMYGEVVTSTNTLLEKYGLSFLSFITPPCFVPLQNIQSLSC